MSAENSPKDKLRYFIKIWLLYDKDISCYRLYSPLMTRTKTTNWAMTNSRDLCFPTTLTIVKIKCLVNIHTSINILFLLLKYSLVLRIPDAPSSLVLSLLELSKQQPSSGWNIVLASSMYPACLSPSPWYSSTHNLIQFPSPHTQSWQWWRYN